MVLISGVASFFNVRDDRADDRFWSAVTSARQMALESEAPVTLHFDAKAKQLIWAGAGGGSSVDLDVESARFLPTERGNTKLLGGVLMETDELTRVQFYPDGTCDAFRVELTATNRKQMILTIDPWTCAPILLPVS